MSVGKSHPPCPLPLTLQHLLPPTVSSLSVPPLPLPHILYFPLHPRIPGTRGPGGHSVSGTGSGQGWAAPPAGGAWEREGSRGGAAASAILSC